MKPISKFRLTIAFVIFGLIISGITAFALLTELNLLSAIFTGGASDLRPESYSAMTHWIL
jgi:hypothetical protein